MAQSTIRWREHISARFLENVKKVHSTDGAFAAILEDKSVVTRGSPDHGGDSSAVKDELRHVEQIHPAKGGAFAAILADRSVATWGHPSAGGDSFEIHGFLADSADVDQIQGSYGAFAAILEDKSVVSWGNPDYGGESSAVERELVDVRVVEATGFVLAHYLPKQVLVRCNPRGWICGYLGQLRLGW